MVNNPEEVIAEWITAGAKRIIIHPKTTEKLEECMNLMQGVVEIGFAFGIDEPVEIMDGVDFIQLMGISNIGVQGEPFNDYVIDKLEEVREQYPDVPISIDGGINLDTAIDLGRADRFVIGSAIYESDNIPQTIEEFRSIINR